MRPTKVILTSKFLQVSLIASFLLRIARLVRKVMNFKEPFSGSSMFMHNPFPFLGGSGVAGEP